MPTPAVARPKYSLARRADSPTYYVQWWEDGKARRVSTGSADEAEARRFLAEFTVARETAIAPDSPTIADMVDAYEADRSEKVHAPQSLHFTVANLRRHLGHITLDRWDDESHAELYVRLRRAEGCLGASAKFRTKVRPIADGTLNKEIGALRAAFAWAIRKKWISDAHYIPRPSGGEARQRWLSREEGARLLAVPAPLHIRVFIHLALYTGARSGAIRQLTWGQVDFATGLIDMGSGRGNKRRAKMPMVPPLRAILAEAFSARTIDYVIEFAGAPVAGIKTGFNKAVAKAGLGKDVTPHIMRHTAISWMVMRRVPYPEISLFAGVSEKMIRKVYGHVHPDFLKEAAAALLGETLMPMPVA